MISRHDAESLLRKHEPVVDGLFLVRKSSKDKGFVLSVVQMSEMVTPLFSPSLTLPLKHVRNVILVPNPLRSSSSRHWSFG